MADNVLHVEHITMQFGGVVAVNDLTLYLQQFHGLPAHPLLLPVVEAEGGGKDVLLGPHVLGDEDVFKHRQVAEKADVLEGLPPFRFPHGGLFGGHHGDGAVLPQGHHGGPGTVPKTAG